MPQPDGSLKTTVFRSHHTDMYLHWDSYHHLSTKFSVINTCRHRAKTVCSTSQLLLQEEENHLHNALRRCKYPLWAWNRVNINKNQKRKNKGNNNNNNNNSNNMNKPYIVVPYMKGLGEAAKTSAENMEWRCISEEAAPSEISWSPKR